MRVLLLTGSYPPMRCGVGDYAASLADALAKLPDTEVAVITDRRARTARPPCGVEIFPIAHGWEGADLPRILRTVRRWAPDVLHLQYPTQGYADRWLPWSLPFLLSVLRIPIVQTWHEHFPMGSFLRSLPLALAPSRLVVVRRNYAIAIPPWMRLVVRPGRLRYIPNSSSVPRAELSEAERHEIRQRMSSSAKHFVAYFGFIYPNKSVELLFDVADAGRDHLVVIGDASQDHPYQRSVLERSRREPWRGKVTVTGFLPGEEVARLLAAVDAVVLPFRDGGGSWNTSLHGAAIQGTFVLTTSREQHGYDPTSNTYFAQPGDAADMRAALRRYIGCRNANPTTSSWESIAQTHRSLYQDVLSNGQ